MLSRRTQAVLVHLREGAVDPLEGTVDAQVDLPHELPEVGRLAHAGDSRTARVTRGHANVTIPPYSSPISSTARNASCGTSIRPTCFMRFLPAFCFSSSLRLREMSPP